MRRQTIALAGAGLVLALGGCAHNDVLVFGTDTKVAIDVETAATQGGSPSITIGYKRKEAVWMPLLVNAKDSKIVPCEKDSHGACTPGSSGAWSTDDAKYKSTDTLADDTTHQTETRSDAYSVFASLGAKFDTSAAGGSPKASGALAQFFATGLAAVNISQNKAVVTALKLDPDGGDAQAAAVAAAADDPQVTSLLNQHKIDVQKVLKCAGSGASYRWPDIVKNLDSAYSDEQKTGLSSIPESTLSTRINNNFKLTIDALAAAQKAPLNCTGA